jgi:hypothetical protein
MHTHVRACLHTRTYTCINVHIHIYLHTYINARNFLGISKSWLLARTCVCEYVFVDITHSLWAHTNTYVHTHTHTHRCEPTHISCSRKGSWTTRSSWAYTSAAPRHHRAPQASSGTPRGSIPPLLSTTVQRTHTRRSKAMQATCTRRC